MGINMFYQSVSDTVKESEDSPKRFQRTALWSCHLSIERNRKIVGGNNYEAVLVPNLNKSHFPFPNTFSPRT